MTLYSFGNRTQYIPGDDEAVATIRPVGGKVPDVGRDTKLKSE